MPTVVVAPREITDLVNRASRVSGCTVGEAARIAADVAYCEVHHGGGIAAWLAMAHHGELVEIAGAARELDGVALDVAAGRSGRLAWSEPIPCALLVRSLAAFARRGMVAAGWSADPGGVDRVGSIELVAGRPPSDEMLAAAESRWATSLAGGMTVDRAEWDSLESAAARFMLAEALLDAADER